MPAIFKPQIAKKHPQSGVIVICSDRKLLWRDSYKGVGRALTSLESIIDYYLDKYFIKNYNLFQMPAKIIQLLKLKVI